MKFLLDTKNYMVTEDGKVWSELSNKFLSPKTKNNGYLEVALRIDGKYKMKYVHRLVAECYIDNKSNLTDVNHIDGNKTNNCVENLEWCSHEDNMKHGWENGFFKNAIIKSSHIVLDTETGIYYDSIKDFSKSTKYSVSKCQQIVKESKRFVKA